MARDKVSLDEALLSLSEGLTSRANNPGILGYKPHDKQLAFHTSEDYIRLYLGGNRAGKTHGAVVEDLWWATNTHPYIETPPPPVRIRVVVVDFMQGLEGIMMPKFKSLVLRKDLKGGSWDKAWSKELRTLTFKNGSTIQFMSYEQDLEKFAGTSQHLIHFDEEPPKHIFNECRARVIDTNGRITISMTPVDGITWVYEDLYQPVVDAPDKEVIVEKTDQIGEVFRSARKRTTVVEVGMNENPHLSREAIATFFGDDGDTSLVSDEEQAARNQGSFVAVGGKVFKTFDRKTHVRPAITAPLSSVFQTCAIYTSTDHGWNNPTAWLWHAVFPSGQVVTFHEHYASEMTLEEHAQIVKSFERANNLVIDVRTGDPAMKQTNAVTGTSILDEYAKLDLPIYVDSVPKDPSIGIAKMQQYFKPLGQTVDPRTNMIVVPGVPTWTITENCVNFITELKNLQWAKYESRKLQFRHNKKEEVHKKNDHAFDSAKYFATFLPDLRPDSVPAPPLDLNRYNGIVRYDEQLVRDAQRRELSGIDGIQWDTVEMFD